MRPTAPGPIGPDEKGRGLDCIAGRTAKATHAWRPWAHPWSPVAHAPPPPTHPHPHPHTPQNSLSTTIPKQATEKHHTSSRMSASGMGVCRTVNLNSASTPVRNWAYSLRGPTCGKAARTGRRRCRHVTALHACMVGHAHHREEVGQSQGPSLRPGQGRVLERPEAAGTRTITPLPLPRPAHPRAPVHARLVDVIDKVCIQGGIGQGQNVQRGFVPEELVQLACRVSGQHGGWDGAACRPVPCTLQAVILEAMPRGVIHASHPASPRPRHAPWRKPAPAPGTAPRLPRAARSAWQPCRQCSSVRQREKAWKIEIVAWQPKKLGLWCACWPGPWALDHVQGSRGGVGANPGHDRRRQDFQRGPRPLKLRLAPAKVRPRHPL